MSEGESQAYVVSAEVKPLEGCEMWGGASGGLVYCYATAIDARDALRRVETALHEDRYEISAFEWAMPPADVGWDDDDVEEQRGYATEAEVDGGVVYSAFNTYEAEHEH